MMQAPLQSGQSFLDDVVVARKEPAGFHIWWLGQSGYLIQWEDRYLLFDPYLSDSLTHKYASTDKPHIRMTGLVIEPEKLDFIDVVTSSHNHTDHLDGETLGALMLVNPGIQIVVPEANRAFAANRLQVAPGRLVGLTNGVSTEQAGFKLTGVPAAHNTLEPDEQGRHKFMGYIAEFGPWTVYHSGDTLWFEGMEDVLRSWSIDLALLPINGNKPERRVAGNLDGLEAATLASKIGARMVFPCHYDMFTFNTATTELFEQTCRELNQPYAVLQNGERWTQS